MYRTCECFPLSNLVRHSCRCQRETALGEPATDMHSASHRSHGKGSYICVCLCLIILFDDFDHKNKNPYLEKNKSVGVWILWWLKSWLNKMATNLDLQYPPDYVNCWLSKASLVHTNMVIQDIPDIEDKNISCCTVVWPFMIGHLPLLLIPFRPTHLWRPAACRWPPRAVAPPPRSAALARTRAPSWASPRCSSAPTPRTPVNGRCYQTTCWRPERWVSIHCHRTRH